MTPASASAHEAGSAAGVAHDGTVCVVSGVSALESNYDVVLLDQYGVIHDGRVAYPSALDAVRRLSEAGKSIWILSNSGRRAEDTLDKITKLGFHRSWFAGAMTSGETTHQALTTRSDPFFAALGRCCLHLTWAARGAISVQSLGLVHVTDVQQADFVLAHGLEAITTGADTPAQAVTMDEVRDIVKGAAARSLPLVIANPDVVTVDRTHLVPMPGYTGKIYVEDYGGPPDAVKLMGKPARVIYQATSKLCGPGRVLAVGDSLSHDIRGAADFGVDSLYVAGGIHAHELAPDQLTALGVAELAATHGCPSPTYAAPFFQW